MLQKGCALLAVLIVAGGLSGCKSSPLAQDLPQTPYQRYAQLRGQNRDATTSPERGEMTPQELRRRLAPLEQQ